MVSLWREREENKERQEAGYAPEGKPCDGVNSILFSCKVRKALCHLLYLMFCFYARIPFALTFDVSGKPDTPFKLWLVLLGGGKAGDNEIKCVLLNTHPLA